MTSPIYAARQWLHDQLQASSDLVGVQVTYGRPAFHQGQQVVAVTGVHTITDEDRILGGLDMFREFTLDVSFLVQAAGRDDNEWVDERGFDLYEVIRAVVVADSTMGGAVEQGRPEGLDTEGTYPFESDSGGFGGWVIFGDVHIRCQTFTP